MSNVDDQPLESGKWHDIFFVLSLEVVDVFLSDLDLGGVDSLDIKGPAREFLRSALAGVDRGQAAEIAINAIAGTDEAMSGRIRALGELLVSPPSNEHQWASLLWLLAHGYKAGFHTLSVDLADATIESMVRIIQQSIPARDALDRVQRAREAVGTTSEPEELRTVLMYLPEALAELITIRTFRKAWSAILRQLSEEELDRLLAWARLQSRSPEWIFGAVEQLPS